MADAADSYPRQSARTRRFTLGLPRDIKIAPDGSRTLFLRSASGSDPINRLYSYDVASGREKLLVDPAALLAAGDGESDVPEAERRRRERARELAAGIVAYDVDEAFARAVFALAGRAFVVELASGEAREWPSSGAVFDPRFDPTGRRIAYVSGRELRVSDGTADQLLVGDDDPDVTWGSAEFVAAEEMHRTRGYWWAPGGERLLVERVDVSAVPTWYIASPIDPAAEPTRVRYPAAGTTNAKVELYSVGLDGTRVAVDWSRGEFEYLCDVSWAPRTEPIVVAQTRDQRTVSIAAVGDHGARELRRITDASWVDLVPGSPAFLGDRLVTVEAIDDCYRLCIDGNPVSPEGVQVRRIVSCVDDAVVVLASADPTEAQVASISGSGELTWLTSNAAVHSAAIGGNVRVVATQSLDADAVSFDVIVDGRPRGALRVLAETPLVSPRVELLRLGDRELRTALLLPAGFANDARLPVLVDPYGGPGHARVLRARNGYLTSQWFADQGFAVVVIDGRGTPGRGPRWDRAIRGDFAAPVLDDQVDALSELAEKHSYLDMSRVGIRGWSFGGYLAALAVLRRPDVFHAAVAGAPVTDWRLYDTHYTERYLGHPEREPAAYERSSLLGAASALERPLLLIHGLADDNVVAAHTLVLSRALLEAGRPHRVLPLSGVTHMTPQEVVAENLLKLEVDFFRETLAIDTPQPAYRWRAMLPRRDSPL